MSKCLTCKYRQGIPDNCHSRCMHPTPMEIGVQGKKEGIVGGWFHFPFNFDPFWLIKCDGYEQK